MDIRKLAIAAVCALLAACATVPEESDPIAYGPAPERSQDAIRAYFDGTLKDPDSVQYRSFSAPRVGDVSHWVGILRAPGGRRHNYGWLVDVRVNAKNSFGGYVGFKTYEFLFHGERIADVNELDD